MKSIDQYFPILLNIQDNFIKELKFMEREAKKFPPGSLFYQNQRGKLRPYYQFYQKNEESGKKVRMQRYLSKKEQLFIELLKKKKYSKAMLPAMQKNLSLLAAYLKDFDSMLEKKSTIEKKLHQAKQDNIQYKKRTTFDQNPSESDPIIKKWLIENELRSSEQRNEENLIHVLPNGLRVRSKSEATIIGMLQLYHVPFLYEAPLELSDQKLFPDFTIMRRKDHKLFYWEHFGMIYDFAYRKKMKYKLEIYEVHDIVPWDNLLISYDNAEGAIDLQVIQHIIEGHLM